MDSQVTLVDIPELRRATASTLPFASKILHFTDNDIHNTKITIAGQPSTHYVVHSDGQATATRVTRITDGCDPVKVGGIQRRSLLPDLLTVGDFEMKLGQWLKMPLLYSIMNLCEYCVHCLPRV
ncbi:hypothetical protein PsYK624_042360 [Phanerochaete sordida]|uniref:Uncharacterized protein n=1 Tax=Phanerochaete sordida TaxID=48140 RepID=A0A9P3LBJ9_9APHY|nr:hypothetical protein PsYK624_042360 [Phanerochaete sordida]